jgi:hypothetical protein
MNRLDPIGTWRSDFRTAQLISVIINIVNVLYAKEGHKPETVAPIDFMPDWTGEGEEEVIKQQDPEEMKQILLGIVKSVQKKNEKEQGSQKPPTKLRK